MTPRAHETDHPVLVVDDEPDVRDAAVAIFENEGHPAVGAENGRQAIDMLKSGSVHPCAIVLDLMMPVMDGWAFRAAQMTDERLASIPVIVVSAAGRPAVTAAVDAMHAVAGVAKPVDWSEVLRLVDVYCRRQTVH
jgi:CheY-like chemotaxis protein